MKAVILAAGKGTRLGQGFGPKPLTLLSNGKSILQLQIEQLTKYFSFDDILIVVGYQKEPIMALFPQAQFLYNHEYAHENTSKSLLKALKKIDDDVLWLNGDIVFHPSVLKDVMASDRSIMTVNKAVVGEEEVKYRTDGNGKIVEVSKEVINPEGEALGINVFKKNDLPLFKKCLEICGSSDYFEKGIECSIGKGVSVGVVAVDNDKCVEIDFIEDVERANNMLKKWEK